MTITYAESIRSCIALALALLLGVGCIVNRATVSPVGTVAQIRVGDVGGVARTVSGELIEVREDGLLILSGARSDLMLLPYGRILGIGFADEIDVTTSVDGPQPRRALALLSRYPFGLDDASLQRLLEAYGQSELIVVR